MKILISESHVNQFLGILEKIFENEKYEGVCSLGFDYDEQMDKFVINIFFDREYAISHGPNFNKVKNKAINDIGNKTVLWLNKTPLLFSHYDICR